MNENDSSKKSASVDCSAEAQDDLVQLIDRLASVPLEKDITSADMTEISSLIANHFRRKHPSIWQDVLAECRKAFIQLRTLEEGQQSEHLSDKLTAESASEQPEEPKSDGSKPADSEPANELETVYISLQNNLIQVRHAVARAIATEKQMEQQVKKNQDMFETWENRAQMALDQKNRELHDQAKARGKQYADSAETLLNELKKQRDCTMIMRQRLTDLEVEVQKVYTEKQVLLAREKGAVAVARANEALELIHVEHAKQRLDEFGKVVVDLEQAATSQPAQIITTNINNAKLLLQMTDALERAVSVIQRLESKLEGPKSDPHQ